MCFRYVGSNSVQYNDKIMVSKNSKKNQDKPREIELPAPNKPHPKDAQLLTVDEMKGLTNLVRQVKLPFEKVVREFSKLFLKAHQFRAGCVLIIMMKQSLLTLPERLVGFYIIYQMYEGEQNTDTTPFLPFVLECVETTKNDDERKLKKGII